MVRASFSRSTSTHCPRISARPSVCLREFDRFRPASASRRRESPRPKNRAGHPCRDRSRSGRRRSPSLAVGAGGRNARPRASAPRPRRLRVRARPAENEMLRKQSIGSGERSRAHPPWTAARRSAPPPAGRARAVRAAFPYSKPRRTLSEPGRAANAAPGPAPTGGSYRWREMQTELLSSLRFSARLKWTRPTRFQAGFRDLEKLLERKPGGGHLVGETRSPVRCHSARSTSGRDVFGPDHFGWR